jgi:hypothetical protein
MLHRLKIRVQGKKASIKVCDDTEEEATCDTKYEKVNRPIGQHFLNDLPLLGCLTGLREKSTEGIPVNGVGSKRAIWKGLYAVHQVIALYHIDQAKWLDTSVKHLDRMEFVELAEEAEEAWMWTKDDTQTETVEAIIDILSKSIEYACGYHVSWGIRQGDEMRVGGRKGRST